MGLTLLAAGTSIPDALASLFVARDGMDISSISYVWFKITSEWSFAGKGS